jgi:hypothetical protein
VGELDIEDFFDLDVALRGILLPGKGNEKDARVVFSRS